MKAIDVCDFDIIKCGVEFVTGVGARPGVDDLLPHMERNENYVYWMQPKGGSMDEQQACICVNGTYYALNNKLEKAIFRNVRLTRDFKNFERLVDGTRKLVIPQRLFQEKLRTSNRNISMMRNFKKKTATSDTPKKTGDSAKTTPETRDDHPETVIECAQDSAPVPDNTCAPNAQTSDDRSVARKANAKRPRKSNYNLHVDCVLEGPKRRKFNLDASLVLRECSSALCAEDHPLIQTPRTLLRSLCTLFEQEFPGMLSDEAVRTVVSALDDT